MEKVDTGRVSVVIPCYNVEGYIEECLDSVLEQGDLVRAIHCVDNASKDETASIIRKWQSLHPGCNLELLSESQPGACAARNTGLARVESPWVQFLDADDLLVQGKLSEQLLQADEADVVIDSSIRRGLDGEDKIVEVEQPVEFALFTGAAGITSANLWRTEVVRSVKGWNVDQSSSQEYELMFRLYEAGARFRALDTRGAIVRARESGQIGGSDPKARWLNYLALREKMFECFCSRPIGAEVFGDLCSWLLRFVRSAYPEAPELASDVFCRHFQSNPEVWEAARGADGLYRMLVDLGGFRFAQQFWAGGQRIKESCRRLGVGGQR